VIRALFLTIGAKKKDFFMSIPAKWPFICQFDLLTLFSAIAYIDFLENTPSWLTLADVYCVLSNMKKTEYVGDYYEFFDEDKSHNKTQKGVCYQYRVKY
jgi:hypothetical protein